MWSKLKRLNNPPSTKAALEIKSGMKNQFLITLSRYCKGGTEIFRACFLALGRTLILLLMMISNNKF
jgi:hypothetical protein